MPKFEIHVFGTVPECLEVEADSEEEALDEAIERVAELLEFKAGPCNEEKKPNGN